MCLFVIRKIGQRKIWLSFQKNIFLLFWVKIFSGSCEKFKNIILFADYIKFGSQNFNCYIYIYIYIYILFWFFFQFYSLEFNFYINFGPHFYNFYLSFPYHFLIEIFYLSNLIFILLIVTYGMVIIIILISLSFNFFIC
jgi:hypothetical protein